MKKCDTRILDFRCLKLDFQTVHEIQRLDLIFQTECIMKNEEKTHLGEENKIF